MLVCSFYFACEAAGASSARHSLRPLISQRQEFKERLARMRGEIAKLCPMNISCHRPPPGRRNAPPDDRLRRAIPYPRDASDRAERGRRFGYPAWGGKNALLV